MPTPLTREEWNEVRPFMPRWRSWPEPPTSEQLEDLARKTLDWKRAKELKESTDAHGRKP